MKYEFLFERFIRKLSVNFQTLGICILFYLEACFAFDLEFVWVKTQKKGKKGSNGYMEDSEPKWVNPDDI